MHTEETYHMNEGTLLTIADISARWSVSESVALSIIGSIPTMSNASDHDHELADGAVLWAWGEVDTAERAFPELQSGDGLEVVVKMGALLEAFAALGVRPGDAPVDLIYTKAGYAAA